MKQMKKLLAFVLAFAMIITIYQPSAAYAATQKTRLKCKDNDTSGGTEKDPESKECREKRQKLKWSSNKKSIATVSKKGVVKAVKAGKCCRYL